MRRMDRQEIIARLRENQAALRSCGFVHAALFGSRARRDNRPESDIDIMVEIAPEAHIGVWGYVDIVHRIEELFPLPVGVSNRAAQKSHVRTAAERDAIYAF
jgi:uncharacterized protein